MKRLVVIAIAIAIASCSPGQKAGKEKRYVAKVNNTAITQEQMMEEFESLPEQVRGLFMNEGGAGTLLNELINKELLYQQAKKEGFAADERLKKAVEEFRKISMIKLLLQDKIEKEVQVTDEELKAYYTENKEDFRVNVPGAKGRGELLEFESIKDLLRQRLLAEKQEKAFTAYMKELKDKSKVDINEEALKEINARAGVSNSQDAGGAGEKARPGE